MAGFRDEPLPSAHEYVSRVHLISSKQLTVITTTIKSTVERKTKEAISAYRIPVRDTVTPSEYTQTLQHITSNQALKQKSNQDGQAETSSCQHERLNNTEPV